MKRYRQIVTAMLLGSVLLVLAAGQSLALQVGDKAPDFALPSTTGREITLADYVGKQPVVLFFYIGAFTKL